MVPYLSRPAGDKSDHTRTFAIQLMQHLVVPTFVLDASGKVIIWNLACERLTGLPAKDVLGTDKHWMGLYKTRRPCLADLVLRGGRGDIDGLYIVNRSETFGDTGLSAENWCEPPNSKGRPRYLAFDAGPIFAENGELLAVVETLRDITAQKEAQMTLEALASQDGLTGIANRRLFDETIEREWQRAERNDETLSMLMIDIDHFKQYNDLLGHQSGDRCLRCTAQLLAGEMLRPVDFVARYGGEEFAVVLPGIDLEGAINVGERILRAMADAALPHPGAERSIVTLSIGASSRDRHIATARSLIEIADASLYGAKRAGRNCLIANQRLPTLSVA